MNPTPTWTVFIPLISALLGAGIGAFLGQYIAVRNKERDEILKEIRATNAAAALCFGVVNSFINAKKQQVKPLYEEFQRGRADFIEFARRKHPPETQPVYFFNANLRSFSFPREPVEQLRDIIIEKTSPPPYIITLASMVERAVLDANLFADKRNEVLDDFRKAGGVTPIVYYGVATDAGADERCSSFIQAMYDTTDNSIMFGKMLGEGLSRHGKRLRERLPRRLKASAPKIVTADFQKGIDMIPPAEAFQEWQDMVKDPEPKKPFWKSLFSK